MTLNAAIPTLWAGSLLLNMNIAHVFSPLCNRDYEGEIKVQGDQVKIISVGRPTIRDYTRNTTITAPETLLDNGQFLVIDQAKYYNFEIDDVDKRQQNPKEMAAFTREAAWALADVIDLYISATVMKPNVATANILDSGVTRTLGVGPGDGDAYETLVDLGVALSANNVPKRARWVVLPPWMVGLLDKDPRFVSYGQGQNRSQLERNMEGVGNQDSPGGVVGNAAGFEIRESNNVPLSSGVYTILSGVNEATSFAEQLLETEMFRPQNRFSDAMKGLCVYGAKVVRPYALASVAVQQSV